MSNLDEVLNGMTAQFGTQAAPAPVPVALPSQQAPRPFLIQTQAQAGFFSQNWPKLLILGLLVLAVIVGIVMYRMNKTKKTEPTDPDSMDERLFVQNQQQQQQYPQQPGRVQKRVRFQMDEDNGYDDRGYDNGQQPDFQAYADYETSDMAAVAAPTDDYQPMRNIQLTPEQQSDPFFEPLPVPDRKLIERKN